MTKVILESTAGEVVLATTVGGKEYKLDFNKANGYKVECPLDLTFIDKRGELRVTHRNYPQHLINSYDYIKLVEEKQEPAVVQKPKKKKEEKHEEVNS